MNKKLGLLLTFLFVGTTAIPAPKKGAAPKKEKAHKEYVLSVKNTLTEPASLSVMDTQNKTYEVSVAPKAMQEVTRTMDKNLKIKSITTNIAGKTTTKEFKRPTRKAQITKDKKGDVKIKRAHPKGRKCDICKSKKCTCKKEMKKCDKCKSKHCKCKKNGKKCDMCKTCKCKPCKCVDKKGMKK
jgi:hypothetical protein